MPAKSDCPVIVLPLAATLRPRPARPMRRFRRRPRACRCRRYCRSIACAPLTIDATRVPLFPVALLMSFTTSPTVEALFKLTLSVLPFESVIWSAGRRADGVNAVSVVDLRENRVRRRLVNILPGEDAVGARSGDAQIGRRLVAVDIRDRQGAGAAGRVGQDEMPAWGLAVTSATPLLLIALITSLTVYAFERSTFVVFPAASVIRMIPAARPCRHSGRPRASASRDRLRWQS